MKIRFSDGRSSESIIREIWSLFVSFVPHMGTQKILLLDFCSKISNIFALGGMYLSKNKSVYGHQVHRAREVSGNVSSMAT